MALIEGDNLRIAEMMTGVSHKKTRRAKKRKMQENSVEKTVSQEYTVFKCMFCSARLAVDNGPRGESPGDFDSEILKICKECDALFPGTQTSGKVHLRPKLNALAPFNSTDFLMDQDSFYFMDFMSPKKLRAEEGSERYVSPVSTPVTPETAIDLENENSIICNDSGFESFLQSQFEMDYGLAKAEHISSLSDTELISNIFSLKSQVDSLQKKLHKEVGRNEPVNSELRTLLEDNKKLMTENCVLKKGLNDYL